MGGGLASYLLIGFSGITSPPRATAAKKGVRDETGWATPGLALAIFFVIFTNFGAQWSLTPGCSDKRPGAGRRCALTAIGLLLLLGCLRPSPPQVPLPGLAWVTRWRVPPRSPPLIHQPATMVDRRGCI